MNYKGRINKGNAKSFTHNFKVFKKKNQKLQVKLVSENSKEYKILTKPHMGYPF